MAKRLSDSQRKKFDSEDGARVFTKRRAAPKAVVEPEEVTEPIVPQSIDTTPVVEAIEENGRQMTQAIQAIKIPEQKAPKVIVESKALIKNIRVKNIERNGQNRIESADFTLTYQEPH